MAKPSQYQVLDVASLKKYKPGETTKVGTAIFVNEGVKPIQGTYKTVTAPKTTAPAKPAAPAAPAKPAAPAAPAPTKPGETYPVQKKEDVPVSKTGAPQGKQEGTYRVDSPGDMKRYNANDMVKIGGHIYLKPGVLPRGGVTLVQLATLESPEGKKQAVESGSPEAKKLFSQGWKLYTALKKTDTSDIANVKKTIEEVNSQNEYQKVTDMLKDRISALTDPNKQKETLVQLYTDLYNSKPLGADGKPIDGSMSLAEIDAKIGGIEKTMTMTEDDIRTEVTRSGGEVTESQVQALIGSRNRVLINNLNGLSALKADREQYITNMMNLEKQDRATAEANADKALGYQEALYNMEVQMEQTQFKNTMDYQNWVAQNQKDAMSKITALYNLGINGQIPQALWEQAGFSGKPPTINPGDDYSAPFVMSDGTVAQVNNKTGKINVVSGATSTMKDTLFNQAMLDASLSGGGVGGGSGEGSGVYGTVNKGGGAFKTDSSGGRQYFDKEGNPITAAQFAVNTKNTLFAVMSTSQGDQVIIQAIKDIVDQVNKGTLGVNEAYQAFQMSPGQGGMGNIFQGVTLSQFKQLVGITGSGSSTTILGNATIQLNP